MTKMPPRPLCRLSLPAWRVAVFLVLSPLAFGATSAQAPTPSSPPREKLQDRIVAVVDDDPILASDVEQVIGLGLAERRDGESDQAFRRRVLQGLIEQSLRFHEIGRFGFEQVPVEVIEEEVAKIRAGFPSSVAFEERLRELDLSFQELRQLVARQLAVLTYVEERLGARVFVSLSDIRSYYEETLVPALEARGAEVPPLEQVREKIRSLLKEKRLNEEIERWTDDLRRQADVEIFSDDYPEDLPPVVERFGEPAGHPGP